ncbi:ATP-dependent DNA helicase RecG [Roseobacter sp. HKCCD9010]|uniref:ATP-dependent DNA helicase RecG n=1 Tax=unclassified Roseobacter TaxID=196798 RepID=UPI0014908DC5|nr:MULTISPECIES: ATP-dependent DNA helicase RecG [unclassified Roseobacter]MBF9050591.1 ATP-dependent DNA helicase RecG [Rhodobacterales bacterium HKCCD4356]NNV11990.1 ATP-dependent DNA helicase RecG [Roseobacter sp. HKCCD7357]NNV17003.1 ATP-dependent DNA helicase RecG [Roseobacter sp. HKCCD8768]NNV26233.1 ATP-dependent DNA helicase RecG [Roseobacter sp. HKCCD8192]NNV30728.1 ATP-dependent DNA helicase RecG [Roseobacter sp. HKCCD9061]
MPEARGRPEILFPLFAGLDTLDGVGPKTAKHYAGLHVETPKDLLLTLPIGGMDRSRRASIREVDLPGMATVEVTVGKHRKPSGRGPYRIEVSDAQTSFQLVFFHARGDYLERVLPTGSRRVVSGKVELFESIAQMPHPDHILPPEEAGQIPAYEPVYPLTAGVTQKGMAKAVASALPRAPYLGEWIDLELLKRKGWPAWPEALAQAHHPQGPEDLSRSAKARERLAYDELLAHQMTLGLARLSVRKAKGFASIGDGYLRQKVLDSLPFSPTGAQLRALDEIAADMGEPVRMSRLLQGDVGAGKTLVGLMALLIAVEAGGQGVMMAPTSILAAQHYSNLKPLAETAGVVIEMLTGADKGAERKAKLAALARGDIQILVGTHAVFQDDVEFADLRLAIVDEQHRFGVHERIRLSRKGRAADMLVMTATPIPRTLSLAQYGDMDISVLDEKPPGRTPVKTALISTGRIAEVVQHLRDAVEEGRQAYWVCPLVEESEVYEATAAEERFKALRAELGEGVVGLVHGQLPQAEKDRAMADFQAGRTRVLVATTVIEVGVDVPNASIMVIEQAEIFGLAQLHQLRGRVGRGAAASTCLLMYRSPLGESAKRRLSVLRETEDGFRIAEEDLAIRGAGDLIGTAQSGMPRFRVADLESQTALMAIAQSDARALLERDPKLESPRGQSMRVLLWLLEQEKAIRLISVG